MPNAGCLAQKRLEKTAIGMRAPTSQNHRVFMHCQLVNDCLPGGFWHFSHFYKVHVRPGTTAFAVWQWHRRNGEYNTDQSLRKTSHKHVGSQLPNAKNANRTYQITITVLPVVISLAQNMATTAPKNWALPLLQHTIFVTMGG